MIWANTLINQTPEAMKIPSCRLLATTILPCALLLSQCAPTAPTPPQAAAPVAFSKQHWVQVSSRPARFYPRGVEADVPTDWHSGEWVVTGDEQDTRFFIPFQGIGGARRQALLDEALAARSEKKLQQIAAEDRAERNEERSRVLKKAPLIFLGSLLSFGASADWLADTDWEKEWYSSKQPHR